MVEYFFPQLIIHIKRYVCSRDVVTFLSMKEPNKWARGKTWVGPTIHLLYINPYPAQNVGEPRPTGSFK